MNVPRPPGHILRRILGRVALGTTGLYLLLLVPEPDRPALESANETPFSWNQDERWSELEQQFKRFQTFESEIMVHLVEASLRRGHRLLDVVDSRTLHPQDQILGEIENTLFELGPMVAVSVHMLPEYALFVTRIRAVVKRQSQRWDMNQQATKDRMYRLLFGGRSALEEVLLQAPVGSLPALIPAEDEPSKTPSARILGVTIHSGDILISRGRSPISALIARANDYPGHFSHAALVHVDEETNLVTIIESDGNERGVLLSTLRSYLEDVKLRILVLRPRANLPELIADPLLPHKAARYMLYEARKRDIPFDFEMDQSEHSKMYCSEVPFAAYEYVGIRLWMDVSHISGPGISSWLSALGIGSLTLQQPSDLEYDPQLRVVAQWRDPGALFQDHVDNAVTDVMLEGAEAGDKLDYPFAMLPYGRMAKVYSMLAYSFGGTGMIPHGMSPASALRAREYINTHAELKERVLALAKEFKEREGYPPPEWELVKMAKQAKGKQH